MLNQTGQAIEGIMIIMGVYLTISLSISVFMNWYNKHIALVERRSEEHTSELQSLMRISYAVFCLNKKQEIYTCLNLKTTNLDNIDIPPNDKKYLLNKINYVYK